MTNPRPAGPPSASQVRPATPKPAAPGPKGGGKPAGNNKSKLNAAMIGYLISGSILLVILIVVVAILFIRSSIGEPTRATTAPGRLTYMKMTLDISGFTKPAPEGAGEAQKLYRDAVNDARAISQDKDLFYFPEMVRKEKEPEKNPKFKPMLDKLVKAADEGFPAEFELTFPDFPVKATNEFSVQKELKSIGWCLQYASMSARRDKKYDEADKYARAELIFGLRLWSKGVYVANRSAGLAMIGDGLALYERFYSKDFQNDAAKLDQVLAVKQSTYLPVSVAWKGKEAEICRDIRYMAGDAWNLAQNDQDRSWRIQGLIRLGVARYTPGNSTRAIEKYLAKRTNDRDMLVAETAKQALDFSEIDKNSIHEEPE